jgi:hypothetical protein
VVHFNVNLRKAVGSSFTGRSAGGRGREILVWRFGIEGRKIDDDESGELAD